ncbi:MAG: hypothetical protein AAGA68_18320 [Pseudomonadota bacterium]
MEWKTRRAPQFAMLALVGLTANAQPVASVGDDITKTVEELKGRIEELEKEVAASKPKPPPEGILPECWNSRVMRCDFDVDINFGWGFDTFTPSDLSNVVEPEDATDVNQSALLDLRFNYKLVGATNDVAALWLTGRTRRTVRGTEVLCSDFANFPGCPEAGEPIDIPDLNAAIAVLRDAESIEGEVGLRAEFLRSKAGPKGAKATPYLMARYGAASVSGLDDLAEYYFFSLGVILEETHLHGSFIDFGIGSNDLFPADRRDRNQLRVHLEGNPFLSFTDSDFLSNLRMFIETEVDFDGGSGSDSVRTFVGVEFPFGSKKKSESSDQTKSPGT